MQSGIYTEGIDSCARDVEAPLVHRASVTRMEMNNAPIFENFVGTGVQKKRSKDDVAKPGIAECSCGATNFKPLSDGKVQSHQSTIKKTGMRGGRHSGVL